MAAFIAKQMVGNQLSAVKDMGVGDNMSAEEKERLAQLEKERLEALREQEERRKEKHRKMEEEREKIRSTIRDKKDDQPSEGGGGSGMTKQDSFTSPDCQNRRNTDEMGGEEDEFTKLRATIEQRINDLRSSIESRCNLM